MRALAWQGSEEQASTPFAAQQLTAVRTACSQALGREVDWADADDLPEPGDGEGRLAGFLLGAGCLVAGLAMLGIWVYGLVALVG